MAFHSHFINDKGQAVFDHYGLSPSSKAQENPFRTERTSSFFVNQGKDGIYFKDFGEDSIKGNWYNLISLFEGTTDASRIIEIAKNIYSDIQYTSQKPVKKKVVREITQQETKPNELAQIEFQEFSKDELDYWIGKGQVTKKTLQKLSVKSVKSFSIYNPNTGTSKQHYTRGFVFAFEIVKDKAYKLYMPKPNYRVFGTAKTAFLPNLSVAKEINPEYSYSFGIDALRNNERAILCEGEADCLALHEQGFNAFTMGNATTQVKPYITAILKGKNIEIASIIYDTDHTGIKAARTLYNQLSCNLVSIPKLAKQNSENEPKPTHNDICDYISLYGFDKDLTTVILSSFPLEIKKYLGEISPQIESIIRENKGKIISIKAPTGAGKTHELIKVLLPKIFNHSIFTVPTVMQAKQLEKDGLISLNGNEKIDLEYESQVVRICTYNKVQAVSRLDYDCLVIDEAHNLSALHGYRYEAVNQLTRAIMECIQMEKTVIFLSATPCPIIEANYDTIRCKITRLNNPTLTANRIVFRERLKDLQTLLISRYACDGVTVCRVDNKAEAKVLGTALVKSGFYQDNEIDEVFAIESDCDQTKTSKSIEDNQIIPKGIKLVFCTKLLDVGTNILNSDVHLINATSKKEIASNLFQFANRFRIMDAIEMDIFESHTDGAKTEINYTHDGKEIRELAVNQCSISNLYRFEIETEMPQSKVLKNNHKLVLDLNQLVIKVGDLYSPNLSYISFYEAEKKLKSQSKQDFYSDLCGYGFQVGTPTPFQTKSSEKAVKALQQAKLEVKTRIEDFTATLVSKLEDANERGAVLEDLASNYTDVKLREKLGVVTPTQKVERLASDNLEASRFVRVLSFISQLQDYYITEYDTQGILTRLHLKNPTRLFDTLKNHRLLQYNINALEKYKDKMYFEQRLILDAIIEAVHKTTATQKETHKTQISQAKRKATIFEASLISKIESSRKKNIINSKESNKKKTLVRNIEKLEAKASNIEVPEFISLVRENSLINLDYLSNKDLFETIETVFNLTKSRRLDGAKKLSYVSVTTQKSSSEAYQNLGFSEIKTTQYNELISTKIEDETKGLDLRNCPEKRGLSIQQGGFSEGSKFGFWTKNLLYKEEKEKVSKPITSFLEKHAEPCPF